VAIAKKFGSFVGRIGILRNGLSLVTQPRHGGLYLLECCCRRLFAAQKLNTRRSRPMIDSLYSLGVIAATGVVTFALRATPFVASQWLKKHPMVQRLGQFLPLAIMALLLIHAALGRIKQNPGGHGVELLAVALVGVLQWRSKNALLSILIGTGVYVLLRNWQV
jgi:branched-subunit amino acid transport protein AzlD